MILSLPALLKRIHQKKMVYFMVLSLPALFRSSLPQSLPFALFSFFPPIFSLLVLNSLRVTSIHRTNSPSSLLTEDRSLPSGLGKRWFPYYVYPSLTSE